MKKNYYEVLRISPDAEDYIIRAAYKVLASKFHPDKNIGSSSSTLLDMQLINEAYLTLSDPEKRKYYDMRLGITRTYASESKETKDQSQKNSYVTKVARNLGNRVGKKLVRAVISSFNKKA